MTYLQRLNSRKRRSASTAEASTKKRKLASGSGKSNLEEEKPECGTASDTGMFFLDALFRKYVICFV